MKLFKIDKYTLGRIVYFGFLTLIIIVGVLIRDAGLLPRTTILIIVGVLFVAARIAKEIYDKNLKKEGQ